MDVVPPLPDPEPGDDLRKGEGEGSGTGEARLGEPSPDAVLLGKTRLPAPAPTGGPPSDRGLTPRPPLSTPRPPLSTPRPPVSSRRFAAEGAPSAPRPGTPYPTSDASAPPPRRWLAPLDSKAKEEPAEAPPGIPMSPPAVPLSPRMRAVFAVIFGVSTMGAGLALLIQTSQPRDERSLVAGVGSAVSSAEASAKAAEPDAPKKKVRVAIPGPWRLSELQKDSSIQIESGVMEKKTLFDVLEEKGIPKAQVFRVLKALEDVKKLDKTGKRDRFSVAFERASKKIKAFEYEVTPSEIYQAREGEGGLLTGSKLDMKIGEEEVTGAFRVTSDIAHSFQAAGLEEGILPALDEALAGHTGTDSFEEGGTVRVIAVEETALGLFSRYKRIVAMEYKPPEGGTSKPIRIYSFKGQEARGYWDDHGKQPSNGSGWRSPVPGAPVTSHFNPKRLHPILHTVMPHQGTDFGAPSGTPVYSAFKGVIAFVGPHGATGNWIAINHPGGIETGYAHLSKFAAGIKIGDKVGTHHLIGYVGTTGRSTGPHLHFSARKNGVFFDAMTLHMDGDRAMPGVDKAAWNAAKAELDKKLEGIPLAEPVAAPKAKPAPAGSGSAGAAVAAAEEDAPAKGEKVASKGSKGAEKADKPKRGAAMVGSPAALASAAAEPGIHPSQFVEDKGDDDDDSPAPPPPLKGKNGKPPPDPDDDR